MEHQEVSVRKDVEPAKTVDAAIDNEDAIDYKASHRKMLELLRAADKQSKEDHPFLGLKPLRQAEQALKDAPADLGAWDRSVLHGTYGQQLLRSGKTIDAIRETLKSVELAESLGDKIEPKVLQQVYYITGVAYLRDAENVNCVNCLNGERCLFPIEGDGIHDDKASSRSAIEFFQKALKLDPQDVKARWLLNICYMTLGEYPSNVPPEYLLPPELFRGAESPVGKFVNIAKDLGLNVKGCAGSVIVDDFDGDLDLDVVFSSWETDASLRFFRNEGHGKFVDATEHANFAGINGGLNLVHADYDNDGDLDILVLRGAWLENRGRHPKSLLRNDGTGRFWDVTLAVGLMDDFYPSQTADWADFDHDGDLDLYIGNEGFPCQLMKNNGRDGFQDIAKEAGVLNGGPTKGSAWGDYDNDGWPDLYVSNLGAPNKLYHNNHDGTFTDVAEPMGVAGPIFSFPVWFWDFDNDGRLDLYVSSYKPGSNFVARDYMGLRDDEEPDAFLLRNGRRQVRRSSRATGFQACDAADGSEHR
ncbi:MAG: VCBS repeat-containing protein [Pirellulales bacterium]